jgi:hypothetical protein
MGNSLPVLDIIMKILAGKDTSKNDKLKFFDPLNPPDKPLTAHPAINKVIIHLKKVNAEYLNISCIDPLLI